MLEFNIPDMSCGNCVGVITETVKLVDPDATVEIDLLRKKVHVTSGEGRDALAQALRDAGYPPSN